MSKSLLNTVLGAATFGKADDMNTITDPQVVQQYFDFFLTNGFRQIDTARRYGLSEELLGSLKPQEQGLLIDTKVLSSTPNSHAPEKVKDSVKKSLEALNVKKVHILYLHAPDRSTPFEDTLRAINEIYQEGTFEKFGLSNYKTEEVEQVLKICRANNYVLPTVYQGLYNAITRTNEDTLFPLLKKEKISFYAYSPVAAGFFKRLKNQEQEKGGRFDGNTGPGGLYQKWYFKDSYFKALEKLAIVSEKYGISNGEIAIRWIYHHSQLSKENGDSVIFGPSPKSGIQQLESNLEAAKKGPLPQEIVTTLEEIWIEIKPDAPKYHF